MKVLIKALLVLLMTACSTCAVTTVSSGPADASAGCFYNPALPSLFYHSKVRHVTAYKRPRVTHLTLRHYPFRTVITRTTSERAHFQTVLHASMSSSYTTGVSASTVFAKIIDIGAHNELHIEARGTFGHTATRDVRVTSKTRTWIPAHSVVAWFRGNIEVYGSARVSTCATPLGGGAGHVRWHTVRWHSYGPLDEGGESCTARAYTAIGRYVRRNYC